MKKIWYIQIDGKEEGPFSIQDLRWNSRFTPDTLVRMAGRARWVPARKIKELDKVFKDAEPSEQDEDQEQESSMKTPSRLIPGNDTLAVDMRYDPSGWMWVIILMLAIIYVLYQMHTR